MRRSGSKLRSAAWLGPTVGVFVLLTAVARPTVFADSPAVTPGSTPIVAATAPAGTAVPYNPPTVSEEPPAPAATSRPVPTVAPAPAGKRPVTGSISGASSSFTTSGSGTSSSADTSTYLPSAAQLRENARLRWGNGIPASVSRWAFLIVPAARKYHIDPNLIAAVMTMESNGDPTAQSYADARGLMQILHGPWDPAANIDEGARELAHYLVEFHGSVSLALAAYNAGEGAVLQYGGVPPYRETQDYVVIVEYLYDLFSHKKLTSSRRSQYTSTLKDLRHFADQKKKVPKLASITNGPSDALNETFSASCRHFSRSCDLQNSKELFSTLDPFWPMAGAPDPLQKVDPNSTSG